MASGVVQNSNIDRNRNILRAEEPRNEVESDMNVVDPAEEQGMTSSMYTLASTQSQFSNALDNWIRGAPATTVVSQTASTTVQDSRTPLMQQRSTEPGFSGSGIWYIMAMILPLFSINATPRYWGCSPSTVLHAAELLACQFGHVFSYIRRHVRRLAQDRVARDLFATAMDVVLIVYALGFLLLSMYQASVFE